MTFQPIVPLSGFAGWSFLQRTLENQQSAFNASQTLQRDTEYFKENIGNITSAEDLVADRRLLGVALGAFNLGEDINNKFFVQKILADGTLDPDALSNKLADSRYQDFAKAFGFGDFDIPNTQLSTFPDEIIDRYQTLQFEVAVGTQNDDMRLALNATRELKDIGSETTSDDAKWFTVMGNPPLRQVFEKALSLPTAFAQLDIDKQLEVFKEKAQDRFGTDKVADFQNEDLSEDLVRMFLLQSEISALQTQQSGTSIALQLLRS